MILNDETQQSLSISVFLLFFSVNSNYLEKKPILSRKWASFQDGLLFQFIFANSKRGLSFEIKPTGLVFKVRHGTSMIKRLLEIVVL